MCFKAEFFAKKAHKYTEGCKPYPFGHLSGFEIALVLQNQKSIEKVFNRQCN
jgi:hypothetical protein